MDGAGAGGAAPERRKQLTAAEAVNHNKRQLAPAPSGICTGAIDLRLIVASIQSATAT